MDIVYFVRPGENEELRYSLRSLKNLPHDKVWIYGSCPDWCKPDRYVHIDQVGATKWDRVRDMFRRVCDNNEISPDFILMNDDFFIMKPTTIEPAYRSTMADHIVTLILSNNNKLSEYAKELLGCLRVLRHLKRGENSYELHIPIVMNRKKFGELLKKYPDVHANRTLYSNYYQTGGVQMDDCKVYDGAVTFPTDSTFLSTTEGSFEELVGKFIREKFPEKSEYETD